MNQRIYGWVRIICTALTKVSCVVEEKKRTNLENHLVAVIFLRSPPPLQIPISDAMCGVRIAKGLLLTYLDDRDARRNRDGSTTKGEVEDNGQRRTRITLQEELWRRLRTEYQNKNVKFISAWDQKSNRGTRDAGQWHENRSYCVSIKPVDCQDDHQTLNWRSDPHRGNQYQLTI